MPKRMSPPSVLFELVRLPAQPSRCVSDRARPRGSASGWRPSSLRALCYDPRVKFDLGILATQPVPEIVRQVQLAESLGFETVWMTDTHLVCRELWVTLTACALGTARIKLGPGVTVPHSRHVSVTASAILTLEELAPGRIVLGMGTGGSSAQTMGLKLEQVGRARALEAMATNIRRLIQRESMRFESGAEGKVAWLGGRRRERPIARGSRCGVLDPDFDLARPGPGARSRARPGRLGAAASAARGAAAGGSGGHRTVARVLRRVPARHRGLAASHPGARPPRRSDGARRHPGGGAAAGRGRSERGRRRSHRHPAPGAGAGLPGA